MRDMFCPQCGRNVGDGVKFCPGCGRPMTEKAAEKRKFDFRILIAVFAVVGVVLLVRSFHRLDYSDEIKDGVMNGTTCTIGDAFDKFFSDLDWKTYESEEKNLYLVDAEGVCYYVLNESATPVTCIVEFVYDTESGDSYVQKVTAGNALYVDDSDISGFLEDVYGYEQMSSPNSIWEVFEGVGNAFVSGLNDGLFGKYISYDEGKRLYGGQDNGM